MSVARRAALTLFSALLAQGCGSDPSAPLEGELVQAVQILPHPDTLIARTMLRLEITAVDALGDTVPGVIPAWESSDTAIARVDPDGWLRGRSPGVATVWARAGDGVDSTTVEVLPAVAYVTVTPDDTLVTAGVEFQLVATSYDSLGNVLTGRPVIWRSVESRFATVDSTGRVRMVSLDSTLVIVEVEKAATSVWVRGGARYEWIFARSGGLCAGTLEGVTACGGQTVVYGSGSSCDLVFYQLTCYALQVLPSPLDTLVPNRSGRDFTCSLTDGTAICWGWRGPTDLPFTGVSGKVGPHPLTGSSPR